MGTGDSDEKNRNLGTEGRHMDPRLGMRKMEVGLNGNALQGNWAYLNVDESEIEAKIAEIRKMAREARELEKKNLETGEADMGDVSDDEDNDSLETETSRIRSGIVKEVDGRLTKLRKSSQAPVLNVNFLNKAMEPVKEAKNDGLEGKVENDMLMFEVKHKFRSHLTTPRDKPKGFQSIKGNLDLREKPRNVDDELPIKKTGNISGSSASLSDVEQKMNDFDNSFPERSNTGSQIEEKKPGSGNSSRLQTLKKRSGRNSETKRLNKVSNGSASSRTFKKASGNNNATEKLNKRTDEGVNPERGVVQDVSNGSPVMDQASKLEYSSMIATQNTQSKTSHLKELATSEMHTVPMPLSSDELGSTLSTRKIKNKQQNGDPNPWWLTLPYVLVILMKKGMDGEGLEGFYTLRIDSDTDNQSYTSYIVAFEAGTDAKNFSYLLEYVFEDLPDANIDVVPLSTKELKRLAGSLDNKVIVVKKGELKLYAGQPLSEVESALRSLVK